jgi:hypothetical protein
LKTKTESFSVEPLKGKSYASISVEELLNSAEAANAVLVTDRPGQMLAGSAPQTGGSKR